MAGAVSAAVLSEARTLGAGFQSLLFRPLPPPEVKPGWRQFGAIESSGYGNLVVVVLLILVFEAPGVHLVLGEVLKDGPLRGVVRGLLLGSSVYLALWMLGDLRWLRATPGVLLGQDALAVQLGLRVEGQVELHNVVGAQPLGADDAKPAAGARAIRITPHPRPNCRIGLRSPVCMRGIYGIPLRGTMLDVYVDDPAGLVSAIEAALHQR